MIKIFDDDSQWWLVLQTWDIGWVLCKLLLHWCASLAQLSNLCTGRLMPCRWASLRMAKRRKWSLGKSWRLSAQAYWPSLPWRDFRIGCSCRKTGSAKWQQSRGTEPWPIGLPERLPVGQWLVSCQEWELISHFIDKQFANVSSGTHP